MTLRIWARIAPLAAVLTAGPLLTAACGGEPGSEDETGTDGQEVTASQCLAQSRCPIDAYGRAVVNGGTTCTPASSTPRRGQRNAYGQTRYYQCIGAPAPGTVGGGWLEISPHTRFAEAKTEAGVSLNKALCDVVAPLYDSAGNLRYRPLFYTGFQVNNSTALLTRIDGMDLVWDLYNEQFATFIYSGKGARLSLLGVGAGAYFGFGVSSNHTGVISAWKGFFKTQEAGLQIPVLDQFGLGIGVGASYFQAHERDNIAACPNPCTWGVGVGGSVGIEPPAISPPFTYAGTTAEWRAWNDQTQLRALGRPVYNQSGSYYVDTKGRLPGVGTALHMGASMPGGNSSIELGKAMAIAVALLKEFDYNDVCR